MADEPTAPADAAADQVKHGYKTTEFWLNLIANIIGALLVSGIFADGSKEMRLAGLAAIVLSNLGYTVVRGGVKKVAAFLLISTLLLAGAGCSGLAAKTAKDIETASSMIMPEYLGYVDADPKLDAAAKSRRHDQVQALQDVIRNAQK